jgi:hypothetical protein
MMKTPIMLFHLSLRFKYSPQHCVFEHPHLCSLVNVRDQVSRPHKPGKTIGYIP